MTDDEAEFPDERETGGQKAPPTAGRRDNEDEDDEGIIEVLVQTTTHFVANKVEYITIWLIS